MPHVDSLSGAGPSGPDSVPRAPATALRRQHSYRSNSIRDRRTWTTGLPGGCSRPSGRSSATRTCRSVKSSATRWLGATPAPRERFRARASKVTSNSAADRWIHPSRGSSPGVSSLQMITLRASLFRAVCKDGCGSSDYPPRRLERAGLTGPCVRSDPDAAGRVRGNPDRAPRAHG